MRLGPWIVLAAAALFAGQARADERDACMEASTRGQRLKIERKLKDARAQLAICTRSECPNLIRQDCAGWMTEVLAALPSVVLGARDSKGRDLVQVRVSIDGSIATERLDGKGIEVDPGVHTLRYEAPGFAPIDEQIVVREGEKSRAVAVTFAKLEAKPTEPKPVERALATASTDSGSPVLAYVLGGVGLAALGVGAYLGLHSNGRARELRDGCGATKTCTPDQIDSVDSERTAGWIVGGVGVAAVGVAIVLLLTHSPSPRPAAGGRIWPVAGGSGGGLAIGFQ